MVTICVKPNIRQPARSEMRFVRPKKPAAAIVSGMLNDLISLVFRQI